MKQLRILILEDLEADAELVKRQLVKAGIEFEACRVEGRAEFLQALSEWRPDIILADYSLPSFDGLSALRAAKAHDTDIPFIFVSGALPEDVAIDAVREGADDYVFKDRIARLAPSLSGALEKREERRKRRLAEDELRQTEERYRHLVELSPDGILVYRNSLILFANKAAGEILGTDPEELVGHNVYDFIETNYQALASQRMKRLDEYGFVPLVETVCRRPDGTSIQVEATSVHIPYQGGQAVLSIIRDVSEKKRLEREILEISGREQRRIGQDLHDTVGQNLAGAGFLAKALEQKLTRQASPLTPDATKVVSLITQSVSQTRALSRGLCPVDIVANGLRLAFAELATNTREFFGIPCSYEGDARCSNTLDGLDQTTATHLYHIALEAVNNAARHSRATRIEIRLTCENDAHILTVEDNGVGFVEGETQDQQGMGLRILDYRARIIGASLQVVSKPGKGTIVQCTLRY
ncbi:MAG: PAS domain S-box protein [Acidobacteria bacterium]|nr:MAG: PAS domain S-box protein [Acidobacteriota bacterium]